MTLLGAPTQRKTMADSSIKGDTLLQKNYMPGRNKAAGGSNSLVWRKFKYQESLSYGEEFKNVIQVCIIYIIYYVIYIYAYIAMAYAYNANTWKAEARIRSSY